MGKNVSHNLQFKLVKSSIWVKKFLYKWICCSIEAFSGLTFNFKTFFEFSLMKAKNCRKNLMFPQSIWGPKVSRSSWAFEACFPIFNSIILENYRFSLFFFKIWPLFWPLFHINYLENRFLASRKQTFWTTEQ